MTYPYELGAAEAIRQIRSGTLTAEALMQSCLDRVAGRDERIGAWIHLDPDRALTAARACDAAGNPGPLAGVPVGVKDLIDTEDAPTCYGSAIHAGHQPRADAAVVAATRRAGGLIMGKTVTTEFAWRNPGATRNPHNPDHTPGGSSSGSAAGVGDGHCPLAFGTQTAGSVIRPAAYCGAVGFKPDFGTYERAGVKPLSGTLDTVGIMARSVQDVALFDAALCETTPADLTALDGQGVRIGLSIPFPDAVEPAALAALEQLWRKAEGAGAICVEVPVGAAFETLADIHNVVMVGEAGRALSPEYEARPDLLIRFYRDTIALGRAISEEALNAARAEIGTARQQQQAALFADVDILLTLPAPGEAPAGIGFTGDPLFNKVWTLLGWPCVTIPCGTGPAGLPLGAQIVAPPGEGARALAAAAMLETLAGA